METKIGCIVKPGESYPCGANFNSHDCDLCHRAFKLGVEHCREQDPEKWDKLEVLLESKKQEGRREVVDSLDWENTAYQTLEGSPIIQFQISEQEWQAKLKDWGL